MSLLVVIEIPLMVPNPILKLMFRSLLYHLGIGARIDSNPVVRVVDDCGDW